MSAAMVAVGLFALPSVARASSIPIDDPLHGYCAVGCIDNSVNSPTTSNPPTNFGFTVSPGPGTGDFFLDILVPDNEDLNPASISIGVTGSLTGTANLFSATSWQSGQLDSYLGISASPTNSFGAFDCSPASSCANHYDPGLSGFYVYQVDLGTTTLQDSSNPNVAPLLNLSTGLPIGSYILGFLNEGTAARPNWIATANSGAILETGDCIGCFHGPGPSPAPEPGSLLLLGTGLIGGAAMFRRRFAK